MKKTYKKALTILRNILLVFMTVLIVFNLYSIVMRAVFHQPVPQFFGVFALKVVSPSMSGALEVNDIVIGKTQGDYKTGDIVTFIDKYDNAVTHRILRKTDEGIVTKGDANAIKDQEILSPDQIKGRIILVLPQAGQFSKILQTPLGVVVFALVVYALFFWPIWRRRANARKEEKDEERNKKDN